MAVTLLLACIDKPNEIVVIPAAVSNVPLLVAAST